ncbi:MAG: BatA domain-containing protein [Flavobacteriales bacterium]
MSFLHPAFLWALAALAIPVLIHLFQLRRFRRVDFTHVRLLAEVTRQTRARRKVQHWLVLLARCMAIAALVLAFAQPYLPGEGAAAAGDRAVSVYIDDSHSMDGQNARGRLLDQARKAAQEIIAGHAATDRFQVLNGRFDGRQQALLSREEALLAAAKADASPYSRTISKVLARQREALAASSAPQRRAYVITDLQRGIADVEAWADDSTIATVIVPLEPDGTANLSIDSAWFASPVRRLGQLEELHARITNHGAQELVNVPLRLSIDGTQRAAIAVTAPPQASVDNVLRFRNDSPGLHWAEISIADQPVTFDDRLWLAYRTIGQLRVLLVSGGDAPTDRAVAAVFAGDSLHAFEQRDYRSLDLALLDQADLLLLNALPEVPGGLVQAVEAFARSGGSVAVLPPAGGDPARHASLFQALGASPPARLDTGMARVDRIDLEHPFYRDVFSSMPRNVDLPFARDRWHLRPAPGSDALLRTQDGLPYLTRTPIGKGSAYLLAAPLAERSGNLARHALFATSLLRMAELSRPTNAPYAVIGAEASLPADGIPLGAEQPPRLLGPRGAALLPEVRRAPAGAALVVHGEDLAPGHYALVAGSDTLAGYALNLARAESDLRAMPAAELQQRLAERGLKTFSVLEGGEDLFIRLASLGRGSKPWKWLIAFALLMLAVETLLLRAKP